MNNAPERGAARAQFATKAPAAGSHQQPFTTVGQAAIPAVVEQLLIDVALTKLISEKGESYG